MTRSNHISIRRYIRQKLFSPVCYLDREISTLLPGVAPAQVKRESSVACRTLIIAKAHYHEIIRNFPFSNAREIREAVDMDTSEYCPFEPECFFMRKLASTGQSTAVNLWFIRPSLRNILHQMSPWLVLPETAVASMALPAGVYRSQTPNGPLMFYIRSDQGIISMAAGDDPLLADAFCRGIGPGAGQNGPTQIDNHLDFLANHLPSVFLSRLTAFFRAPLDKEMLRFHSKTLKAGFSFMAILLLVFFTIWFALPAMTLSELEARNQELDASLGPLMERQADLDQKIAQYMLLGEPLGKYTPRLTLFNLLHQNLPKEARLSRLTLTGSRVEIMGESERASDVLGAIKSMPGVREPGFSTPIRKNPRTGKDIFVIGFVFEGGKT